MADVIHVAAEDSMHTIHDAKNEFKKEISQGLSRARKQIPSKYFYDQEGSELFNRITRHPDYYLTQCEIEILTQNKNALSRLMSNQAFNLIELGPGEGIKTKILIEQFLRDALNFTYMPIDISTQYLRCLMNQFNQTLPHLKLAPIHSDYFQGLEWLSKHSARRNIVLFLGSSIGNMDAAETRLFLSHLWQALNHGDYVLMGFDLRKDINVLMRAYNDSSGITRDFNLNLLKRINRDLDAHFVLDKFCHYATYNVYSGAMESYLMSLENQTVYIDALKQAYGFEAMEAVHVEYSHKYLLSQIEELARLNGFQKINHFLDSRHYFVDSLWLKE